MMRTIVGLALALMLPSIRAQPTPAPVTSSSQEPPPGNVASTASPRDIDPMRAVAVEAQLESMNAAVQKLAAKADRPDYTTAAGGLIGVLVGAMMTWLTQRRLLAQERELASRRAALEIGSSFVQWQLKQLSELYGPLHALLVRSRSLYLHMNRVLVSSDPQRFRFMRGEPADNSHGPSMEILYKGGWVPFRTLLHLEEVYGSGYGTDDYFSEIVETGGRMVKIIQEKAGYVRPDQEVLPEVFGRYLAHYSVLRRLYDYVRAQHADTATGGAGQQSHHSSKPLIAITEEAVFPREIDGLVKDGYFAIRRELGIWRARADER